MLLPNPDSEYEHDEVIRYYGIRLSHHRENLTKLWQQRQYRYSELTEVINAIHRTTEYDDTGEICEIKQDITLYHDIMRRIAAIKEHLISSELAAYSREKVFTILDALNRDTATSLSCIRRAQADVSDQVDHHRWYGNRTGAR